MARTASKPAKAPKPAKKPVKPAASRLSVATVDEYLARLEDRRNLQRDADAMDRQVRLLQAEIVAYVDAHGGRRRTVTKGRHTIRLIDNPGAVKWKDELIRIAGPEAAERLQAAAPPRVSVEVS